MTRAIITAFHKYQPYGEEYYQPIFDFFVRQMSKFKDEYDKIYFIDSTWNFTDDDYEKMKSVKGGIIKVDPSLRYYDAYKKVLPQIKEDLVLFMDNDMVVYKPKQISGTFDLLEARTAGGRYNLWDVVSIIDQIGEYKTDKLKNGNKFCPYWFATRKELLMKYLEVEWGPDMPYCETLGHLTEAMLDDGVKVYEWEEDKSNILFDGSSTAGWDNFGKDLGYYHIRAGSTPAYLLATKKYGDIKTYEDYLKNQPKSEYLRQFMWYWYMCSSPWNKVQHDINEFLGDIAINSKQWLEYSLKFKEYHGLV